MTDSDRSRGEVNLQEEEGNGFQSFQTRLPWSEACCLACRMGEAPSSETRGAVMGVVWT